MSHPCGLLPYCRRNQIDVIQLIAKSALIGTCYLLHWSSFFLFLKLNWSISNFWSSPHSFPLHILPCFLWAVWCKDIQRGVRTLQAFKGLANFLKKHDKALSFASTWGTENSSWGWRKLIFIVCHYDIKGDYDLIHFYSWFWYSQARNFL